MTVQEFLDGMATDSGVVMVIGGSDTGKTTLVEKITARFASAGVTAVVDLDTGQSRIGPPTTLSWGILEGAEGGFPGWNRLTAERFYFTGATSPVGNLLPTVVGARMMVDDALGRCGRVVVDTTGLVAEPVGRILKQYKIELVRPGLVAALERGDELAHIIDPLRRRDIRVVRVEVPEGVVSKSPARRAAYRKKRYAEYFSGSRFIVLSTKDVVLEFTRDYLARDKDLVGRVASLRDGRGRDLALAIVEKADLGRGRISVRTPVPDDGTVFTTLLVGSVRPEI